MFQTGALLCCKSLRNYINKNCFNLPHEKSDINIFVYFWMKTSMCTFNWCFPSTHCSHQVTVLEFVVWIWFAGRSGPDQSGDSIAWLSKTHSFIVCRAAASHAYDESCERSDGLRACSELWGNERNDIETALRACSEERTKQLQRTKCVYMIVYTSALTLLRNASKGGNLWLLLEGKIESLGDLPSPAWLINLSLSRFSR
jgi:hypothetical protein